MPSCSKEVIKWQPPIKMVKCSNPKARLGSLPRSIYFCSKSLRQRSDHRGKEPLAERAAETHEHARAQCDATSIPPMCHQHINRLFSTNFNRLSPNFSSFYVRLWVKLIKSPKIFRIDGKTEP